MTKVENCCPRVKGTSQCLACPRQALGSARRDLRNADFIPLSANWHTPSWLDIVLSQMQPASGYAWENLPPSLAFLTSQRLSEVSVPSDSFRVRPTRRKDADIGSALLSPQFAACKRKLFSFTMMGWVFSVLVFLSELTFCLDSLLAPSSGKILKNWSRQKITGCPSEGMLRLNVCMYPCLWLLCNFKIWRKLRLIILVHRIKN